MTCRTNPVTRLTRLAMAIDPLARASEGSPVSPTLGMGTVNGSASTALLIAVLAAVLAPTRRGGRCVQGFARVARSMVDRLLGWDVRHGPLTRHGGQVQFVRGGLPRPAQP